MRIDLKRPPSPLAADEVERLPGSCGVYLLLAGESHQIVKIGCAGGLDLFGLRSALSRELEAGGGATAFQYEVNMQYWARWRELLVRHVHEDGLLPAGNPPGDLDGVLSGRLSNQR